MTGRVVTAGYSLLLVTLLIAHPAQAEFQGSLALSVQDFHYKETDPESPRCNYSVCDTEDGAIPGLQARLRWQQPKRFVETGLVLHGNAVDYWSPQGSSRTSERILDWDLLGGLQLVQYPRSRIDAVAGLGFRDWRRAIKSTDLIGLVETYSWWYLQLGLRGEQAVADRTRLVIDARLLRPLDPGLDVHFNDIYTDITLEPEARPGYRIALQVERDLQSGMVLWLSPWLEVWELAASPAVDLYELDAPSLPTGDRAHEPDSSTRSAGVMLGVRWQL